MKNKQIDVPIYESVDEFEKNLPKTVELLHTEDGHKVFVIGTVHYSIKSHYDVASVIRNTKPSVVMLELCPLRKHMLDIDEETLLREASSLDKAKMLKIIRAKGLVSGMFYISFLKTNARITKQLGVAPGGECRRAVIECKKLKNCKVLLGDRSIDVTMQRALKPLSWLDKLRLSNIFNEPTVTSMTPADVEAYKNRDTDYLASLRQHFPSVYRSFVTERDQILAHNLMLATKLGSSMMRNLEGNGQGQGNNDNGRIYKTTVVGVVGMGHMNGIVKNFGRTKTEEIRKMMQLDLSSKKPPVTFRNLIKLLTFLKTK